MRSRYPFRQEAFGGLLYEPQREAYHVLNESAFALLSFLEKNQFRGPPATVLQDGLQALANVLCDNGPEMLRGQLLHNCGNLLAAPTVVEIYPTLWCNERCEFCYVGEQVELARPEESLERGRIRFLADSLFRAGVFNVTILGGEPFLYTSLDMLLEELTASRMDVSLSTNGTVLDRTVLEVVAKQGVKLNVALHGANEATHNRVTRSNSFAKVIRFLEYCGASGVGVHVTAVLQDANASSIEDLVGLLSRLGVRSMTVSYPHPAEYAIAHASTVPFHNYAAALRRAVHAGERVAVQVRGNCHYSFLLEEYTGRFAGEKAPNRLLYGDKAGRSRLEMTPNGDLYPSSALFGLPRFKVANLFHDEWMKAWVDSPVLESIRNRPLPVGCRTCPHESVCGGGILGERLARNDSHLPPGDCPILNQSYPARRDL